MTSLVVRKMIGGGVVKPERVQVICPACGEEVEAVATDGRVKGYCAVAKQYVDFLIETQLRDSSGHFVKGNVPWNKGILGLSRGSVGNRIVKASQIDIGNRKGEASQAERGNR